MTLEELQELSMLEILQKINYIQRQLNNFRLGKHARRKRQVRHDRAKDVAIATGKIIPLYYQDEFTGLHYRATGPANYLLNNSPPDHVA